MDINKVLIKGIEIGASDIHITVGSGIVARLHSELIKISEFILKPNDTAEIVRDIMNDEQFARFEEVGELDFSYAIRDYGRFRVNAFHQRGSCAIVFRIVANEVPSIEALGLPKVIRSLTKKKRGLILVTGPTGSGKSTTLAAMIDEINNTRKEHVITIEDPIEYLHRHKMSIVNQREIGNDSHSFANALRASLRQDPDIILVGEMRDLETIATALTAAETGHLVLSTLHTIGAAKTIDRIVDVFPPHQQGQIRVQLGSVLESIISQQLMPKIGGKGRVVANEILIANHAARNIIREGKTHQLQTIIQTGKNMGMITMDDSLVQLYRQRIIDRETLIKYSVDIKTIQKFL